MPRLYEDPHKTYPANLSLDNDDDVALAVAVVVAINDDYFK